MKSPVNHLGSRIEQQQYFRIPLQAKIIELDRLTTLLKNTLQSVLPDEAVQSLRVIQHDQTRLVVSTDSHTLANHLNYMSQSILDLLHHEHAKLQSVTQLTFRVILLKPQHNSTDIALTKNMPQLQSNPSVKNVTLCELSDLTLQNITQLSKIVTSNEKLVQVLQELAKKSKP